MSRLWIAAAFAARPRANSLSRGERVGVRGVTFGYDSCFSVLGGEHDARFGLADSYAGGCTGQELGRAASESLKRMRNSRWKIPQVTSGYILHVSRSIQIDGGQPAVSVEHQRPLVRCVPMQFPDSTRRKPHIDAGNLNRGWECLHVDLPRPASFLHTPVRERS